uniref:Uncharacterized protein n=1 Tax=Magallana gigas TaxID=29159 RepID=K1PKD3_MAGGI
MTLSHPVIYMGTPSHTVLMWPLPLGYPRQAIALRLHLSPGFGATNAEIFSNLRFLRKFEFFSPNCATK